MRILPCFPETCLTMKRRNFLKSLAGLPALALFPWSSPAPRQIHLVDPDAWYLTNHDGRTFFVSGKSPAVLRWVNNDGLTPNTALDTIAGAVAKATHDTVIYFGSPG